MFHGLTFLPVILSLVGPEPYETSVTAHELKEFTDITYVRDSMGLHDLSKTKAGNINGYMGADIPRSSSQLNEGFNDIIERNSYGVS